MALTLEALHSVLSQVKDTESPQTSATAESEVREPPRRRKELPEHFPREDNLIQPGCTCPECGGPLKAFGKPDTAEVLEVRTVTFTVTRHIRPKGAAPSARRSSRRRHRRARSRRAMRVPRCWPRSCTGSMAVICRCTDSSRCSPSPAS